MTEISEFIEIAQDHAGCNTEEVLRLMGLPKHRRLTTRYRLAKEFRFGGKLNPLVNGTPPIIYADAADLTSNRSRPDWLARLITAGFVKRTAVDEPPEPVGDEAIRNNTLRMQKNLLDSVKLETTISSELRNITSDVIRYHIAGRPLPDGVLTRLLTIMHILASKASDGDSSKATMHAMQAVHETALREQGLHYQAEIKLIQQSPRKRTNSATTDDEVGSHLNGD